MKTTNRKNTNSSTVVPRLLDLEKLLSQKSYFLFGPRQTGKTFLIRHVLKNTRVCDT
jgi:predicted AAA+ superfamily ATPase